MKMVLKEIGKFSYEDLKIIILESKEKNNDEIWFTYYMTIEGYGLIESVFGVRERKTGLDIWNHLIYFGLESWLNRFDRYDDEEE